MSSAAAVSTADFEAEVLGSDIPVLVDFWAPWCPPCRAIAPLIDSIADEYQGRAKVLKIDVDEEPEIAARYGIRSIPTLIVFKNGQKAEELVGAGSKQAIVAMLVE